MKINFYNTKEFQERKRDFKVKKQKNTGKIVLISASLLVAAFFIGNIYSNSQKPSIEDYIEKNRNQSSYQANQNTNSNTTSSKNNGTSSKSTLKVSSKVKYTDQYDSTSMSMNQYDYMAYQNYLSSSALNNLEHIAYDYRRYVHLNIELSMLC